MLLQHLYELAQRRKREGDPAFTDPAFIRKQIRWIIQLDNEGRMRLPGPLDTMGENRKAKEFDKPQAGEAKNAGGKAEFLADTITGLFGLDTAPELYQDREQSRKDRNENNLAKYQDFWQQLGQAHDQTQHQELLALLKFNQATGTKPTFLRWGVGKKPKAKEKPAWWITTATGDESRFGNDYLTFEVDGHMPLLDDGVIRPYWRSIYARLHVGKDTSAQRGICLVTGEEDVSIARTHETKIIGVKNTGSGGAIVSFDKDAFRSYGFEKSYNAPVSIRAAKDYCDALTWLLRRRNHSLTIGETSVCFWAKESEEATDFLAAMLDRPQPEQVHDFLTATWAGTNRQLLKPDQFYSVTLAGNTGRVVVRHWMQMTVAQAVENFKLWFTDLDIATYSNFNEERPALAIKNLARTTLRESKGKKLKDDDLLAELVSQLYRAALEKHAPSLLLVHSILERFKSDLAKNGLSALNNLSRFALLRLIINRHEKEKNRMIDPIISDTDDVAYNCGRLLAVFDELQRSALSTEKKKFEGAGVVDRYYGAASSTPNNAFGVLWRLHHNHLKKLSQQGDRGRAWAQAIRKKIEEIASRFKSPGDSHEPPQFPRFFDLQAQGRFALGFYQQKAFDRAAARKSYLAAQTDQPQPANLNGDTADD